MAWSQALDGVTPGLVLGLCVILVLILELSVLGGRKVLCGCGPLSRGRFAGTLGFCCNSRFVGLYYLR